MDTDWELEGWLLEAGERAERKALAGGQLTAIERLVREFWVFDVQARNGGVSQYFCNYPSRWEQLKSALTAKPVPPLDAIVAEVDRIIDGASDPYLATLGASPRLEQYYEEHQLQVRWELRRLEQART